MSTKFNKLDEALNKLLKKIDKSPQDLVFFATKEAEGILKFRIFNETKTVSGQLFGSYRSNWKNVRKNPGKYGYSGSSRQTVRKDLQFSGDLKDSIRVARRKKNAVLKFSNVKYAEIAEGQEKQIGRGKIFELSEEEKKEVLEKTAKQAIREIRKMIKESFK